MPHLALSCLRHLEQFSSRAQMPQRGIKTYCRPKIAPRAHFLDAEGHAASCKLDCFCFGCDVRLSCVLYRTTMLSHMLLFLSVVFGLLGLSAFGFSIETAYDIVVVYIYIL